MERREVSGADIVERYRDTMGLTREGAIRRMHALMDRIEADAATITALRAEVERKDAALDNIRALAVKSQRVGGPNGTLAHIEGFARAALERAKP